VRLTLKYLDKFALQANGNSPAVSLLGIGGPTFSAKLSGVEDSNSPTL